jgi:hypothetical protein
MFTKHAGGAFVATILHEPENVKDISAFCYKNRTNSQNGTFVPSLNAFASSSSG